VGPDRTVIVRNERGGERTLRARVILLATGSHPHHRFINTTFNFPTRADAYKYAAYDGLQRLQARAAR